MSWKNIELQLEFITPAFIGDAFGKGELRTPPFKHLIRFWWRIAVAKNFNYIWNRIRDEELSIFGSTQNTTSSKSRISISLKEWREYANNNWSPLARIKHPRVQLPVYADLYLGYGPLSYDKNTGHTAVTRPRTYIPYGTKIKVILNNDPINPVSTKDFPYEDIIKLIHWFGTIGSRGTNGWGSLQCISCVVDNKPLQIPDSLPNRQDLIRFVCPLAQCLTRDFPSAIAEYNGRIGVWVGASSTRLVEAMNFLAAMRVQIDTSVQVTNQLSERHILSYPVTHHNVNQWPSSFSRLQNQVIFKVFRVSKNQNTFTPVIVHLAHSLPNPIAKVLQSPILQRQTNIWQSVYGVILSPTFGNIYAQPKHIQQL